MAIYKPPSISSLPFAFGDKGYTAPDFTNVNFNFTAGNLKRTYADLQAAVRVMQLYPYMDNTYTYVKECRTIVVGYGSNGIQVLKLPCLYGGIRDLSAYLSCSSPSADLQAYIFGSMPAVNLQAFIRVTSQVQINLSAVVKVFQTSYKSLYTWFVPSTRSYKDLTAYTRVMLGSKIPVDLQAYIADIQPVNLNAFLNVIEIRDFSAYVKGVWLNSYLDVTAQVYRVYSRSSLNLSATLGGYQTSDLKGYITTFWTKDLKAEIFAGHFKIVKDLLAEIGAIPAKNLYATIQGYDLKDLYAQVLGGYGPNDINAFITAVAPKDLFATIRGFIGIRSSRDLLATISSYAYSELSAYISAIDCKNLSAYINVIGGSNNLFATITPKTINIKRVLTIPLFEHKDLFASINYSCFASWYKDLTASIYVISHKDLKAYIIGWNQGTASNLSDLKAYINVRAFEVQDNYSFEAIALSKKDYYATYDISGAGAARNYRVFDTYSIIGGTAIRNLYAYINGILEYKDLSCYIKSVPLANFTTVPEWVNPQQRKVVINLDRFELRWRRFIEIMFFTNSDRDYHYFYVSGDNTTYKIDKNRTWMIEVEGYTKNKEDAIEKVNARKKFIFNLKDYSSVDEAMRTMIARVSELNYRDISAQIDGVLGNYSDLSASINSSFKSSWVSHLSATITAVS